LTLKVTEFGAAVVLKVTQLGGAVRALPSHPPVAGKGIHSSTSQLNLIRF
jgi:hypothetical protein